MIIQKGASRLELLKLFLKHGADPNYERFNSNMFNAILYSYNESKSLQCLLEYGANPNGSYRGDTFIHIAAQYHKKEAIILLFRFGADEKIKSSKGRSIFDYLDVKDAVDQGLRVKGIRPPSLTNPSLTSTTVTSTRPERETKLLDVESSLKIASPDSSSSLSSSSYTSSSSSSSSASDIFARLHAIKSDINADPADKGKGLLSRFSDLERQVTDLQKKVDFIEKALRSQNVVIEN